MMAIIGGGPKRNFCSLRVCALKYPQLKVIMEAGNT